MKKINKIKKSLIQKYLDTKFMYFKALDRATDYKKKIIDAGISYDETSMNLQESARFWDGAVDGLETALREFYSPYEIRLMADAAKLRYQDLVSNDPNYLKNVYVDAKAAHFIADDEDEDIDDYDDDDYDEEDECENCDEYDECHHNQMVYEKPNVITPEEIVKAENITSMDDIAKVAAKLSKYVANEMPSDAEMTQIAMNENLDDNETSNDSKEDEIPFDSTSQALYGRRYNDAINKAMEDALDDSASMT